jgi:hypothetical protein
MDKAAKAQVMRKAQLNPNFSSPFIPVTLLKLGLRVEYVLVDVHGVSCRELDEAFNFFLLCSI